MNSKNLWFLIILCIFSNSIFGFDVDIKEMKKILNFENNTSVTSRYEQICKPKDKSILSTKTFLNMCNIVQNSSLCKGIPKDELVDCKNIEHDKIDTTSWSFITNCGLGLWESLKEFILFIKDLLVFSVNQVFPDKRQETKNMINTFHSGLVNYVSLEYEKAVNILEGESKKNIKAINAVFGNLLKMAFQKISEHISNQEAKLSCYRPKTREKKLCKFVGDFVIPPAMMFTALYKIKKTIDIDLHLTKKKAENSNITSEVIPDIFESLKTSLNGTARKVLDKDIVRELFKKLDESLHTKPRVFLDDHDKMEFLRDLGFSRIHIRDIINASYFHGPNKISLQDDLFKELGLNKFQISKLRKSNILSIDKERLIRHRTQPSMLASNLKEDGRFSFETVDGHLENAYFTKMENGKVHYKYYDEKNELQLGITEADNIYHPINPEKEVILKSSDGTVIMATITDLQGNYVRFKHDMQVYHLSDINIMPLREPPKQFTPRPKPITSDILHEVHNEIEQVKTLYQNEKVSYNFVKANNKLIKKLQLKLNEQGVYTSVIESSDGTYGLVMDAIKPRGNYVAELYLKMAKRFNANNITFDMAKNLKTNSGGSNLTMDKYVGVRTELGIHSLVSLLAGKTSQVAFHELRHQMRNHLRSQGHTSLFDNSLAINPNERFDLFGNFRNSPKYKSDIYSNHMSMEELYNYPSDIWDLSKNLKNAKPDELELILYNMQAMVHEAKLLGTNNIENLKNITLDHIIDAIKHNPYDQIYIGDGVNGNFVTRLPLEMARKYKTIESLLKTPNPIQVSPETIKLIRSYMRTKRGRDRDTLKVMIKILEESAGIFPTQRFKNFVNANPENETIIKSLKAIEDQHNKNVYEHVVNVLNDTIDYSSGIINRTNKLEQEIAQLLKSKDFNNDELIENIELHSREIGKYSRNR